MKVVQMIIDYLKVLWPNFCMWIIMIFSGKFRERPVKDINNRIIYYFIWLWHFGRQISIIGIVFGLGLQINLLLYTIILLFPLGISFEYAEIFYYTTLGEIVFGGLLVQIVELAMRETKKFSKISLYIVAFILVCNCIYCAIPYIVYLKRFPVACVFMIVMISALYTYGFYKIKKDNFK